MSNIAKIKLNPAQQHFIEELATLLLPWGMQGGVARLYALLILQPEPVSLDAICEALEISKSTASVTARQLEQAKLIKRVPVKGSKRVLYVAASDNAATVADQALMLGRFAQLLSSHQSAAESEVVNRRLQTMADFSRVMQQVMEDAIRTHSKA
ncbi:GbsR/MarR family transcriptional regulator [Pseudomaricurvus sp. HS19]|uniref:GbsR/MarR family transcriptional regulator n=1 Tax=Pseudomaricurvus sp. HS19 TaxID=2692626 RepID=UPI00136C7BAC|nr:MarR family transcriptional regulator [Pseudomaricurvus sp. HS19]MYM64189.1 helix-turn-helix domain-containing protein [Pseudomaricurvus sp. HS19]